MEPEAKTEISAPGEQGTVVLGNTPGVEGDTSVRSVPVTEQPGDRIGRYKLLQEIGEGGCRCGARAGPFAKAS